MSESSSASPRPRTVSNGVRRACLNWAYGSAVFAVVDVLAGNLRSTRDFDLFLSLTWLVLVFSASLLLGLLPAALTGATLASQFARAGQVPPPAAAFQRGVVIALLFLLPVLVILLVAWPRDAGTSALLFRALTASLIAALAGGRTGVQLARLQGAQ